MNKIARTIKLGAAATAIAASAAMVQAPAAQAAPVIPAPTAIGDSLGLLGIGCVVSIGNDCVSTPGTTGGGLFYLGPRDGTPPSRYTFFSFNPLIPLALIPVLGPPLAGFFASLNLEVCIAGLSARIGPYGTISASIGSGC
jgi:hypothetical protein